MKRGTVFGIVCACIALFLLAGITIFVTYEAGDTLFNDEQSKAVTQADDLLDALNEPVAEAPVIKETVISDEEKAADTIEKAAIDETEDETEEIIVSEKASGSKKTETVSTTTSEPSYIWVGDSRTLGMRDTMENNDIYIGEAGEGYYWFMEKGLKQFEEATAKYPDLPVIINFGVNDCSNMTNYLSLYKTLIDQHPTNTFYFLGIYPVSSEATEYVTNEEIAEFNAQLKAIYPDTFLDSYTFLLANEIQTIDGIHYSEDTYRELYNFATAKIN